MYKASFITENTKKVSECDFLAETINSLHVSFSQKTRPVLENIDLSEIDFSEKNNKIRKNFDGWIIRNVIFSKFNPKSKEKKSLFGLSFRGAKMDRVVFAQASLDRCNFDCLENEQIANKTLLCNLSKIITEKKEYTLKKVDFFFSEFIYCRFTGCVMDTVDFRYAKVSDCSMRKVDVKYGDFYFCNFKGCSAFQDSEFKKCSFTNAVFENTVIRWGNIKGILQDDIKKYREVVNPSSKWYRRNPCGTLVDPPNNDDIRNEAIEIYKQLSGIYAGKGLYKDSNAAYRKMKIKDIQKSWKNIMESVFGLLLFLALLGFLFCVSVKYGYVYINCNVVFCCFGVFGLCLFYYCFKDCIKQALQYIFNWLKIKDICGVVSGLFTFIMGYGYRWTFAISWYVLLIIIGACLFCNGEKTENFLCNCACDCSKTAEIACKGLTFSIYNSVGSYVEEYVCVVGSSWAIFQTVSSFLLIGYLGFIFANKMRNNL